jgi:hypothetical protein
MRRGICPKCNSNTVYATDAPDSDFKLPRSMANILIATAAVQSRVACERYVCVSCGYYETYVSDREFLNIVPSSQAWIKV